MGARVATGLTDRTQHQSSSNQYVDCTVRESFAALRIGLFSNFIPDTLSSDGTKGLFTVLSLSGFMGVTILIYVQVLSADVDCDNNTSCLIIIIRETLTFKVVGRAALPHHVNA